MNSENNKSKEKSSPIALSDSTKEKPPASDQDEISLVNANTSPAQQFIFEQQREFQRKNTSNGTDNTVNVIEVENDAERFSDYSPLLKNTKKSLLQNPRDMAIYDQLFNVNTIETMTMNQHATIA